MMKKRRMLALLLVFSIVLVTVLLTGCKPGDEGEGEETDVPEEDLSPAFGGQALRFSGSFTVLTEQDRSEGQAFNIVDLVEKDNLGDSSIVDAVATRNDLIKKNFGVTIKREASNQAYNDALQAVNTGNDSYDAFMLGITNGLQISCGGAMLDLSQADYIDLNQEWWDQGVVENLLLAGSAYIAVGDLLTVDKDGTWCVLFNKDNLSEMNKGLTDEKLYQLVKDGIGKQGGWTLEYLMTQAQNHSKEEFNSDNLIWETDYQGSGKYGIFTQGEATTVLLQAAGYTPTIADQGNLSGVKSNIMSTSFADAVNKVWQNFGQVSNSTWFLNLDTVVGKVEGDGWQIIARGGFMANKATFFVTHVGTINLIRDMKSDFGILPIPKLYETETEYGNTIQYGNGHCYVVPSRNDSLNEKSAYILEAMAFYSSEEYFGEESLNYAYYMEVLRGKASRDDASWEMLDLIFETRVYDFACALDVRNINSVLRNSMEKLESNWTSNRDANLSGFDTSIAEELENLTGKS